MRNKLNKGAKMYHICAMSADYSELSYVLFYGAQSCEYLPKSRCSFLQTADGNQEYGQGAQARWYTIPAWLVQKLQGLDDYKITK